VSNFDQPCISLATGTISPDLRVNYEFGMVLGLNEFLQEQQYFLDKDYLHERALHGYGTVSGLEVTTSTPTGTPADVTITVAPGIAIDQWGREIVVRSAQCARLGAWLGQQLQKDPGAIGEHLGLSGDLTVYVVASYAECPDDLVPLPGQPCSSSAETQVPSRTRDAWNVELRWTRPAMPAWDGLLYLARLLDAVEIVAGLDPALSSEEDIIAAVRALPGEELQPGFPFLPLGSPPGSPPGPPVYRLPAATAFDALDRILTVWVTEVRPQLNPNLIQPDPTWDPAVLLSTITFSATGGAPPANPAITSAAPDDGGRPFLLNTQLIQELRTLTGVAIPPPPPPPPPPKQPEQLVSISSGVDADGRLTLSAWFHLDQPVLVPGPVKVAAEETALSLDFDVTAVSPDAQGLASLWSLTAPADPNGVIPISPFPDGSHVTAFFDTTQVQVNAAGTTLAGWIAAHNVVPLGLTGSGQLIACAVVGIPTIAMDFVTITALNADQIPLAPGNAVKPAFLELWFHPDPGGLSSEVTLAKAGSVSVHEESTGSTVTVRQRRQLFTNIWVIQLQKLPPVKSGFYLRVEFPAGATEVIRPVAGVSRTTTLDQYMQETGIRFVGWDSNTGHVVAFCRVP
jgi:hypothetical protein